jgi:hypothetical protein
MRDWFLLLLGGVVGGVITYLVFVKHFAAAIEARVRAVLTAERQRFSNVMAMTGKEVGAVGQGISQKIASESSKL